MTRSYCFVCVNPSCRQQFDCSQSLVECPSCGGLLDVRLDWGGIDVESLKKGFRERRLSNAPLDASGVWRYRELLPFEESDWDSVITLKEGNCPILDAPASARYANLKRLRVKHLGWNPTGSFKDYGMTVASTQARKLGASVVACASTGNTSASLAAYCARSRTQRAVVFIPEGKISFAKLSQTLDYGALTLQIEGNFDQAMRLVRELAHEGHLYLMNSINPFRLEGQKAIVFEMLDQLDWEVPDRLVVPGGNLGNAAAIGKALMELDQLGFINSLPKVTVVQAAGAAPLASMWRSGAETLVSIDHPQTRATAIRIGAPVSWPKALRTLRFTGGNCVSVAESEIADAKAVIGRDGIGCEPASATTVAGLRSLVASGEVDPDEDILAILTGHQLKDSDYTVEYHQRQLVDECGQTVASQAGLSNQPIRVRADKSAIVEVIKGLR